jgi:hypothetical protein
MPSWVLDYVIMHELAHLLQPSHGRDFWALLESYPRTERARGYLEGVVAAQALGPLGAGADGDEPLADDVEGPPAQPSAS